MFFTMNYIFKLKGGNENIKIKMSFLEIYNETIRDLIRPSDDFLDIREDPQRGVQVAGLEVITVRSASEVLNLLSNGNRNRIQESTGANNTSSRSHAVL
jgi:kinesin family member 18/19